MSNLGNPKTRLLLVMLPHFAPAGGADFLGLVTLGMLMGYAIATVRLRHALRRPRIRLTLDGITGLTLSGWG